MTPSFRQIIRQTYEDRNLANPAYSLGAFARDLKVPLSTLSEVLNEKKGLSPKRAELLASSLRLPDWQKQLFCDLVAKDHSKSPRRRLEAKQRLAGRQPARKMQLLNHTAMRALTSWVDLAILELTHLPEFKSTVRFVAGKLGVNESVAAHSLQRLKEAKLLVVDRETGRWQDASPFFSTTDGVPSEAIRLFHRSVLNQALKKLESTDPSTRTVKTAVFSLARDRLPRAQEILNEAIAKIVALTEESGPERDDVFCFSAQLFSLLDQKDPS